MSREVGKWGSFISRARHCVQMAVSAASYVRSSNPTQSAGLASVGAGHDDVRKPTRAPCINTNVQVDREEFDFFARFVKACSCLALFRGEPMAALSCLG